MNAVRQKNKRIVAEKYLRHVRSHGCLVCGQPSQAHHLKFVELAGMARKVGDDKTVPLCAICHHELHRFGDEKIWWALQGIDPLRWAEQSWREYNETKNHG